MLLKLATSLALGLLLAISCVAAQAPESAAPSDANYAIVCSRVLRPGVSFHIGVALFKTSSGQAIKSITARLNTTSKGDKFSRLQVETSWERQGAEEKTAVDLSLMVDAKPAEYDPVGTYKLEIRIVDTLGKTYLNSTDISLSESPVTTLIQTDKAIYKPGQLVKFRVVNLDESLKPLLTDMEIMIKDSRSNLVDKQTHNITALNTWSDKAVMTGEFQLSDMPNEGDWTIIVKSAYGTETKSFNVRQYVLPKFSLELIPPSFVHFNDREFTVGAKVVYTYNKAVEGTFNATIGPFMNCMSCKDKYDQLEKFSADSTTDGVASFKFNLTKWRQSLGLRGYKLTPIFFTAQATIQFKEKFTGEIKLAETTFYIYTKRFDIKVDTSLVPFFLPGFEVPVKISLVQPDSKPFTGKVGSKVLVSVTYQQRAKKRVLDIIVGPLTASSAGTGTSLSVKIPADADFHPIQIDAEIAGEGASSRRDSSTIQPFIAVTNDYVKVVKKSADEDIQKAETRAWGEGKARGRQKTPTKQLEIVQSAGIRPTNVFYAILSRGQVQRWDQYTDSKLKLSKADLTNFVSDVTVVAFGVDSTGEIVASVLAHEVSRFGGKVSLKSNLTMNKGEPQQYASISVTAEPESFVFVTGIDASVNLLATGQDILQNTLADRYKSRVLGSRYWPRHQRLTTARILQENGLIVLSDGFYYTEYEYMMSSNARSRTMMKSEFYAAAPQSMRDSSPAGGDNGKTQIRKFFPETMVWTVVQVNSEGKAQHTFRMPDTITSWDVTAFGVANDKQIQTMDEAFKVTTFKNFFIRPVLPYSVVRGEKFLLKVLVFNYRSTNGKVTVALNFTESDADVKVAAGQTSTPTASGAKKLAAIEVTLQASSSGMAIFELTPRSLPSLELAVNATFIGDENTETDVVIKSIFVIPEGKTVYKSKSVLLSPPANGGSRPQQTVSIEYPDDSTDLVSGSEVFSYSIIGDVMGPAMQNIGSLLRLPSGCGEQNMVNFAPAVFILEYLINTKQENNEVKEKALKVMKVGLQRQLTYKRYDGSYSAFGENDVAGSAWLTAFVLSIYAKASSFITIEPDALTGKSVEFLLSRQSTNDEFSEPTGARVLDQSLQGSSAKASHGMTAFICLALLDVDEVARNRPEMQSTLWKDMNVMSSISKCLWYVKSAFDSKPKTFSSYDIALSLYLLRRAKAVTSRFSGVTLYNQGILKEGIEAMQAALEEQAERKSDNEKFWSTMDPYWARKTGSVEATSWALLSSTMTGDTEDSLKIMRWLSNQQTSLGGFQTSQATVVGIRALTAFAQKSGLVSGNADIEVKFGEDAKAHSVLESRRLVLAEGQLLRGSKARVRNAVVRHVSGSGYALVTLSWKYNLLDKQPLTTEWKSANGLGIQLGPNLLKPPTADQFHLSVCSRANSSDGMLILRVTNPSGFSVSGMPDTSSVPGLKRVEPGPQEIVMYFDYISQEGVCVTIWWTREVPVLDLSPQLISLQKYYNTEQIVSASYLAPEFKSLTQCKACPDCPECQEKETWLTWFF